MLLISLFLLIIFECTPPSTFIAIKEGNIINYQPIKVTSVKGYGKVSAKINGELLEGTFDMIDMPDDSSFSITFYNLFGTTAGYIKTNKDSAYINFGGRVKKISLFDNLDSEIAPNFFNINLSEIIKIFSQQIINEISQKKTLEIKENGNRIFYIWEDNNIKYIAIFLKKSGAIKNFMIEISSNNMNKKVIEFKKFYGNFAKILSFYVDGQNYFYLRYENIKRITIK